jgi:hypothetical protein
MGRLPTPEQRALGLKHSHEAARLRFQAVRDAEKILCDRTASSTDKRNAREILQQWREKQARRNAKRRLGPRPQAQYFPDQSTFLAALEKWRLAVRLLRCEAVLDNPASSMKAAELAAVKIEKIKARQNVPPKPGATRLILTQNNLFKRVPA